MTRPRRRFLDANEGTEEPGQHLIVQVEGAAVAGGRRGEVAFHRAAAVRFRWEGGLASRFHCAEFDHPSQWWNWLEGHLEKKRQTWVWSHGAHAAFLLLGGWQRCTAKLLRVGFLLDKDPPWLLRFKISGLPLTWADLRNFFPLGHDEINERLPGDTVVVPKDWAGGAYQDDLLFRNSTITLNAVIQLLHWHRANDLGCLGFTSADVAMRSYRHRFAPRVTRGELCDTDPGPEPKRRRPICWPVPLECEHAKRLHGIKGAYVGAEDKEECCPVHELERAAYYGPLFTCHQLGPVKGPVFVADCQSHYASMMRGRFFPSQYLFSLGRADLPKARALAESKAVIASVRLCSPDWPYPVRRGGRVGLALGHFDTVLPGPELLHALDNGAVEVVWEMSVYRPAELFTPFVDWYWNQRCIARHQKNRLTEGLCKDVLNKMSGKWAQASDRWEVTDKYPAARPWGIKRRYNAEKRKDVSLRYLGDTVQIHAGLKYPSYYFPAISAFITSYARLHMAWVVEQVGQDEVFYNPVDCLHLTARGFKRLQKAGLLVEPSLGSFRLEKTIRHAVYYGPGAYCADGVPSVCGLPRHALQVTDTKYEYTRVEHCSEVFTREVPASLLSRTGTADTAARTLWGRERADGRVFPPVLDHPESVAEGMAVLEHRRRMEDLRHGH